MSDADDRVSFTRARTDSRPTEIDARGYDFCVFFPYFDLTFPKNAQNDAKEHSPRRFLFFFICQNQAEVSFCL